MRDRLLSSDQLTLCLLTALGRFFTSRGQHAKWNGLLKIRLLKLFAGVRTIRAGRCSLIYPQGRNGPCRRLEWLGFVGEIMAPVFAGMMTFCLREWSASSQSATEVFTGIGHLVPGSQVHRMVIAVNVTLTPDAYNSRPHTPSIRRTVYWFHCSTMQHASLPERPRSASATYSSDCTSCILPCTSTER